MLSRFPDRNRLTERYHAAWAIAVMLCTWATAQMLAGLPAIARQLERSACDSVAASPLTPALSQKERESFQPAQGSPRSLPTVHSRAEFDSLAVVYDPNTP